MSDLNEEIKTLITITRHITSVRKNIHLVANKLVKVALVHDASKLKEDEFYGFVEVNRIARTHPYGSKEYKDSLADNKVIELHFSRNSHHPEYYLNGINDMSLIDIIEMVCDWKAASETYGQTSFIDALEIQKSRFNLTDEQMYLVKLIAKELE